VDPLLHTFFTILTYWVGLLPLAASASRGETMSGNEGTGEGDLDWLRVLACKLVEDHEHRLPEPDRLRALATDAGQRELVHSLLRAFTPKLLPARRWQDWLDGGQSPREAVTVAQFASGPNSGKRKVADAAGVYEKACERVAKAKARVEEVRRTLFAAEAELVEAEESQARDAAKAQGAILWLLLREISRRVDLVYARGPAANLIDALCCGFSLQEAEAFVQKAGDLSDDQLDELDTRAYGQARRALRVLTSLDELRHSPGLEADLRRVIVETCERHAANRTAAKDTLPT
jgi:hypothetical protein